MRKILLFTFIISVVFISCNRVVEIEVPPITGKPSVALLQSSIIDSGDDFIEFEIGFHVADDRGQFVRNLNEGDFDLQNASYISDFGSELISIEKSLKTSFSGDYEVMFLMDQSGSISSSDFSDSRISAAKIFLDKIGTDDFIGLSSFSGYDYEVNVPLGKQIQECRDILDVFSYSEGGGTPLYYSTFEMVNYLADNAKGENKALIVFTDGEDTEGYKTPQEIINNAKSKNIKVFTVGLGSSLSNLDILSKIATETGGYFMFAEEAEQLISYFGTLGSLLYGDASYYKTRWRVTTSDQFYPGQTLRFDMEVKLSPLVSIFLPVIVTK